MDNRDIRTTKQSISSGFMGGGLLDVGFSHKQNYSNDDLFQQICNAENLFEAWRKFRRGKRSKRDVMVYERNIEKNLFNLQQQFLTGTYKHDPYRPFIVRDPKERQIHKATVKDKGLPLGNLTSQLFANIYLHEFDFFMKHKLHAKWYLRYCDDFIIINDSRERLVGILAAAKNFLRDKLRLDIHPNKISTRTWRQGIDFVGYVHFPHHTVLRTKTKNRMLKRINEVNLTSYLGLCGHADTFELRKVILSKAG